MKNKPCSSSCPKCGSSDICRRYHEAGADTNGSTISTDNKSSEYVDRRSYYIQPALKECIVHVCRVCGYRWDTAPL